MAGPRACWSHALRAPRPRAPSSHTLKPLLGLIPAPARADPCPLSLLNGAKPLFPHLKSGGFLTEAAAAAGEWRWFPARSSRKQTLGGRAPSPNATRNDWPLLTPLPRGGGNEAQKLRLSSQPRHDSGGGALARPLLPPSASLRYPRRTEVERPTPAQAMPAASSLGVPGASPTGPMCPLECLYQSHRQHPRTNAGPAGHLCPLTQEHFIFRGTQEISTRGWGGSPRPPEAPTLPCSTSQASPAGPGLGPDCFGPAWAPPLISHPVLPAHARPRSERGKVRRGRPTGWELEVNAISDANFSLQKAARLPGNEVSRPQKCLLPAWDPRVLWTRSF